MKTIDVYNMYIKRGTGIFKVIGSVEYDDQIIDPETIWDLTNWSCWMDYEEEPTEASHGDGIVYKRTEYDRGYTNDDICFCLDGVWYAADRLGWSTFATLEQAKRHIFDNAQWIRIKNECDNPVKYEDLIC